MKTQINFRASPRTQAQLEKLVAATGRTQSNIIELAIDMMAQEEFMKAEKYFSIGSQIEICDLRTGELSPAIITTHTSANFRSFAGVVVEFPDGYSQEVDREFLDGVQVLKK